MTGWTAPMPRSLLYVPASRPDLFDKAHQGPADAIVIDLEDAVPLPEKAAARDHLRAWLDAAPTQGAEIWVRVSAEQAAEDLEVAAHAATAGVMAAKATTAVVDQVDKALQKREQERGLAPISVVPLVETAAALVTLATIAAHPRVRTLAIGEVDLLADLRLRRTPGTEAAVDALRLEVVRHAAAAGLAAPVAPTSTDFRDLDAFAASTRHLVELGFRSRTAVHPAQVPVVNDVLTPDDETLAEARTLVALAEAAGGGVTVDEQGRLVDAAVVREAHEVLARA